MLDVYSKDSIISTGYTPIIENEKKEEMRMLKRRKLIANNIFFKQNFSFPFAHSLFIDVPLLSTYFSMFSIVLVSFFSLLLLNEYKSSTK